MGAPTYMRCIRPLLIGKIVSSDKLDKHSDTTTVQQDLVHNSSVDSTIRNLNQKVLLQRPLLTTTTAVFAILLLLFSMFSFHTAFFAKSSQLKAIEPEVKKIEDQAVHFGLPTRLKIPAINVDSSVQKVSVNSDGEMGVPSNITDVGWYSLGTRPGVIGSAVISGHSDGEQGEVGVFSNLDKLNSGDRIYVENDQGVTLTFVVRESRSYNPGFADEVFNQGGYAHLNLITCDGFWNNSARSYSKRLVVFTDIVN